MQLTTTTQDVQMKSIWILSGNCYQAAMALTMHLVLRPGAHCCSFPCDLSKGASHTEGSTSWGIGVGRVKRRGDTNRAALANPLLHSSRWSRWQLGWLVGKERRDNRLDPMESQAKLKTVAKLCFQIDYLKVIWG